MSGCQRIWICRIRLSATIRPREIDVFSLVKDGTGRGETGTERREKMNDSARDVFDVVVIGAGIAGMCSTVSANRAGAQVAVLERATEEEFGGNTRWTEAYLRMASEEEVSDDFEERLGANAGYNLDPYVLNQVAQPYEFWQPFVKAHGMPDPELIGTLAARAPETIKWLKKFGIKFDRLPTYFVTAAAPRLMPIGGGLAMIERLRDAALSAGVNILYETVAIDLRRTEDGGYEVSCLDKAGQKTIRARSVIIASGGFEGNPEMLTQYLGRPARYVRPVARGGYLNRGEGIRMALGQGAAGAGDFSSYHAEPLDPRSVQPEPLVMNFPYGILVNRKGKRFVDEAPGPVDVNYDPISRAIADQPDGIAYVVYDEAINDVPNWKRSIRTDRPPITSDSLANLGELLGIEVRQFVKTVMQYNEACTTGEFTPLEVDGLSTSGLEVEKSNWARPIRVKPFSAYPIISGICFTYGGIKVNSKSQVVSTGGSPVDGLFSAGEVTGLYHQVYTGATSVLRGAVFGKIAGEEAAQHARTMAGVNQ